MSSTMYQISVPVFLRHLRGLANCLGKAQVHYTEKRYDEKSLLSYRLYPDMFHFSMQVQMAIVHSTTCIGNLAGVDVPRVEGTPESLEELIERVNGGIAFIEGVTAEQIDDTEAKEVTIRMRERETKMTGFELLQGRALPNFYFHVTTAYAIMRHNGVEIGKRDFMGA